MSSALVEIPAVYLDLLSLGNAEARLMLGNRWPEPGEGGVPLASDIVLELIDTGGVPGILVSSIRVYVQGVLAYDGSNGTPFRPGFDGGDSAITAIGANIKRIVIDPTSNFTSDEIVAVHVAAMTTDTLGTVDHTYDFVAADVTAPKVVQATATSEKTVLLAFDSDVNELDATSTDDALNPANYVIEPLTFPAITPIVIGVRIVTTSTTELIVNTEMSQRILHKVTVSNVQDLAGNVIDPSFHTANFTSYACPAPADRDFNIYRQWSDQDRREDVKEGDLTLKKFSDCLQDVVDLLLCQIDHFSDIWDPDVAPENFLDAILDNLGNPFPFGLSVTDKRRLAQVLVQIYKEKGTAKGIINAVRFFVGVTVDVDAFDDDTWTLGEDELGVGTILGPGTTFLLYAFDVISPVVLTTEQESRIDTIVNYMKPAHTHYMRLLTPPPPEGDADDWELGLSELGVGSILH
jgi:phage tail-like protein